MSEKLLLKWNNHLSVMNEFKHFLLAGTMIDVTLVCDDQSIKAHKLILSACSSFFKSLFLDNPCMHPIVILKDIKYVELKAIIDFIYFGEVSVEVTHVSRLVKLAQSLKVVGLGDDPESPNNHNNFDSENLSDEEEYENLSDEEEYENLSDIESINESVCTLDVINGSYMEEQSAYHQKNNINSKSEVVIMKTSEKKKEMLSENKSNDVSCSSDSMMHFQSHGIDSSKSKKDMPNLEGQALATDSLTRDSPQSSVESNMEPLKNRSDNMPSLMPIHLSSGQTFNSSEQSNMEKHQMHSDNMPSLVSIIPIPTLSGQSPAQTGTDLNKNQAINMPGLISSTHLPLEQSFQSSAQSNIERNKNHLDHTFNSVSITSTPMLQKKSVQSPALSSKRELKKIHSNNKTGVVTITKISQKQLRKSPSQSNKKLHQNQLTMTHSLSEVSIPISQEQSCQSNAISNTDNHSHNIPGSNSVTSILSSQGQCTNSNKDVHQNLSHSIRDSHSIKPVLLGLFQSPPQSEMELDQNHSEIKCRTVFTPNIHVLSNPGSQKNVLSRPSTSSGTYRVSSLTPYVRHEAPLNLRQGKGCPKKNSAVRSQSESILPLQRCGQGLNGHHHVPTRKQPSRKARCMLRKTYTDIEEEY